MFIVCQIGAREHYAIPRALHASGKLAGMFTDFWVPPESVFSHLPGARRLRDRFHPDLTDAPVQAPNTRMLAFELQQRLAKRQSWDTIPARNNLFQQLACAKLSYLFPDSCSLSPVSCSLSPDPCSLSPISSASPSHFTPLGTSGPAQRSSPTVFSYSYAALEIFRHAKRRGWRTVLGQIDPGPEEERIVAAERERYRHLASSWQPAPTTYWESWREELELADCIIVNSEWSRQCLLKEHVPPQKIEVVPLVYGEKTEDLETEDRRQESQGTEDGEQGAGVRRQETGPPNGLILNPLSSIPSPQSPNLRVLFLGQINLRKGVGRLLDAMRLLKGEPVELTLAGPVEIDPTAWADLPNVRWVGPVARSEVGRYYEEADLFILPTLSDGYAITQLEALSHGLPVMASKHCGAAVTHGENGWILDDLEPETIATAIRRAMDEYPSDIRAPEFSLHDLATALTR